MDRRGVREKVPEGSGEQGKMEETGYEIICGTTTTIAIKEQMMMCCSVSSLVRWVVSHTRPVLESVSSFGAWEFLLHDPRWNLSVRSEGGGSLLNASSWNLSDRSSGGKSLLHVGLGVSLTHPLLKSV